jgi:hypothetical protein
VRHQFTPKKQDRQEVLAAEPLAAQAVVRLVVQQVVHLVEPQVARLAVQQVARLAVQQELRVLVRLARVRQLVQQQRAP